MPAELPTLRCSLAGALHRHQLHSARLCRMAVFSPSFFTLSLCACVWILISFSYNDTVTPDQGHLLGYTWRPTSPVAQLWDQRKTAGTMTETSTVYQTEDLSSPKHKVLRSSAATLGMTQLVGLVMKQL